MTSANYISTLFYLISYHMVLYTHVTSRVGYTQTTTFRTVHTFDVHLTSY